MVLLKRLLLPGKGAVISCILILLNVMYGETVTALGGGSFSPSSSLWNSSPLKFSSSGALLVTFNLISLQIPRINAQDTPSVNLSPQGQTQLPVLYKTDPLSFTARGGIASQVGKRTMNSNNNNKNPDPRSVPHASGSEGGSYIGTTTPSLPTSSANNNATTLTRQNDADTRSGTHNKTQNSRGPKLLKEMTMMNRQNCLAKLLCGVQVAQPPTSSSSAVNDYAYLVKTFFDRFSLRGLVTDALDTVFTYEQETLENDEEQDDEGEEDDEEDGDRKKKKKTGGSGKKKYYNEYDKYMDDLELEELVEDDVPDFYHTVFRRRQGKNMTFVAPFIHPNSTTPRNHTLGKSRRRRMIPVDINRVRRKRGLLGAVKRGFMGFFNPRFDKTAYLNKRQLEIESTNSTTRQLNIAEEVASRIRSARQCRLLNWFGSGNSNNNQQPGMTTTITTITNTGAATTAGMTGNDLEKLNGLANVATAGAAPPQQGQVVTTVIQQTPAGTESGGLLSSALCPFTTKEMQDLIIKAQDGTFPHFLTTTTPKPTVAAAVSTSTAATVKTTKAPPPRLTTVKYLVQKLKPSLVQTVKQSQGNSKNPHGPGYVKLYGSPPPKPTPFVPKFARDSLVPAPAMSMGLGISSEDDEGVFEDAYQYDKPSNTPKHPNSLKRFKTSSSVPKWLTTTSAPSDDDFYRYNEAVPNYSYGLLPGGYRVDTGYQTGKTGAGAGNFPRPPPVVVDSGTRYKGDSGETGQLQSKKFPTANKPKKPGKQSGKTKEETESEEDSEEWIWKDGSSDEASDDDASNESQSSAGSGETRTRLKTPPATKPSVINKFQYPKTLPTLITFGRSALTPSKPVETSWESESSNEAEEKKEITGDEDDSEEDDHGQEDGLRSYERNDFSKDRGGPQQSSTEKPYNIGNKAVPAKPNGFLSNIFNSLSPFNSIRSLFKKEEKRNNNGFVQPSPLPPRPSPQPSYDTSPSNEESNEQDDDDETSEEDIAYQKIKKTIKKIEPPTTTKPPFIGSKFLSYFTKPKTTTRAPIIVEGEGGWPNSAAEDNYSGQEDDSGQQELQENPIENYQQEVRLKNKNKHTLPVLSNPANLSPFYDEFGLVQGNTYLDNTRFITGYPVSSDLVENEWFSGVNSKPPDKKKPPTTKPTSWNKKTKVSDEKDDSEEDDYASNESEEDDTEVLSRPANSHGGQYSPAYIREPID